MRESLAPAARISSNRRAAGRIGFSLASSMHGRRKETQIKRRKRISSVALTVLMSVAAVASGQTMQPSRAARANVVLITIDTLRADHLGCYGNSQVLTPNIDRLAAEGTRFKTAVTSAPLTLPSHCSIMTGTYPMFHGVRDNVGYKLDSSVETLAQILKRHGYSTGAVVGSYVLDRGFGLGTGFDF